MNSILESLFLRDIRFAESKELKRQCSEALDKILRIEAATKAALTEDQWKLASSYVDAAQRYHELNHQLEFERGFLLGAKIMLEVLSREQATPIQE